MRRTNGTLATHDVDRLLTSAAHLGHPQAAFHLGLCYEHGYLSLAPDKAKAASYASSATHHID
jgi:TPR repeat protein